MLPNVRNWAGAVMSLGLHAREANDGKAKTGGNEYCCQRYDRLSRAVMQGKVNTLQ